MQTNLKITVHTHAKLSAQEIARLVQRLINVGLADAQETIDNGEGDLDMAEKARILDIRAPVVLEENPPVPVMHTSCYGIEGCQPTYEMQIEDSRLADGRVTVTTAPMGGDMDDLFCVTTEIGSMDDVDHVPIAHIGDSSDLTPIISVYPTSLASYAVRVAPDLATTELEGNTLKVAIKRA